MASRPALEEWLDSADELLDGPVLVGRRLGVVPQERGRHLELRYGSILGDEFLQLVDIDPTTGQRSAGVLVRRSTLVELRRHLLRLDHYLGGTTRRPTTTSPASAFPSPASSTPPAPQPSGASSRCPTAAASSETSAASPAAFHRPSAVTADAYLRSTMDSPDTDRRIAELWDGIPASAGPARADLLLELADHLMEADRDSEALPVLETAQDLLVDAGDDRLAGRAAHNRGVVLGRLFRPDEQLAAEGEAITFYERAQRRDLAGCSRMSLGFHLRTAGRLREALAVFLLAEEDFGATHERGHLANAMLAIVEAQVDLGRFPAAHRRLRSTLKVLADAAPVAAVARLHELAATVFEVRSGSEVASRALRNARAVWDALDEEMHVAACDRGIAVLTVGADPKAASDVLKQLRLERQEAGDVDGVTACDRGIGLALLARRRPHQALRCFDDAAAVFQACALFADAAECESLAAAALIGLGRDDEAAARIRAALPALSTRPRAEAAARACLAALLLKAGEPKAALREAKRAESIARRGLLNDELNRARELRHRAETAVTAGHGSR